MEAMNWQSSILKLDLHYRRLGSLLPSSIVWHGRTCLKRVEKKLPPQCYKDEIQTWSLPKQNSRQTSIDSTAAV